MNIVLEGAKGTGKSTLAKHFIDKGFNYHHSTSQNENDFNYHMNLLKKDNMILDRFSLGEMIYPKVYGREGKINLKEFIETFSDENTIYVVLFTEDCYDYVLEKRVKDRDGDLTDEQVDDLYSSAEKFRIAAKFLREFNEENILVFNTAFTSTSEIINNIEMNIEELERKKNFGKRNKG